MTALRLLGSFLSGIIRTFPIYFYDVAQNPYFKTATNLLVYRNDRLCYETKKMGEKRKGENVYW